MIVEGCQLKRQLDCSIIGYEMLSRGCCNGGWWDSNGGVGSHWKKEGDKDIKLVGVEALIP